MPNQKPSIWKRKFLLLLLLFCLSSPPLLDAHAQDAKPCIETGLEKRSYNSTAQSRYLQNTCNQPVLVFWCVEGQVSKPCTRTRFYRDVLRINPNEKFFNPFTLPVNGNLHYGACYGKTSNVIFTQDGSGKYGCTTLSPVTLTLSCPDERKVTGTWETIKSINGVTEVKFTFGWSKKTLKLSLDELAQLNQSLPPKQVMDLACNPSPDDSLIKKLKAIFIGRSATEIREIIERCHNLNDKTPECILMRKHYPFKDSYSPH